MRVRKSARRNQYAAPCCVCEKRVSTNGGFLTGPPWKTWCPTCWDRDEPRPKDGQWRPPWVANYAWVKARPYQRIGVQILMNNRRWLLTDQMGLGKSMQALLAIPPNKAVVVVCPSGVRPVWAQEAQRWRPDLKVNMINLSSQVPKKLTPGLWITSYGMVEKFIGLNIDGIIADEAQYLKNHRAKRTRRFRSLVRGVLKNERYENAFIHLLTGTPVMNNPNELWCILRAANLHLEAFDSREIFEQLFDYRPGFYGGKAWGKPMYEAIRDRLTWVSLGRRRSDVLKDLPEKSWREFLVDELDEETIEACDSAVEELRRKGIDIDDAMLETELSRLGGPGFEHISRARKLLAISKLPAMLAFIEHYEAADEPVVVYSYHRAPADFLKGRYGWGTLTGDMSIQERADEIEAFQKGHLLGLACTIQAAGLGITLTHAAHAIFVDLAWNPAQNIQAEDRLCRYGQTRGVIITNMVADHALDKRISGIITRKQSLSDGVRRGDRK